MLTESESLTIRRSTDEVLEVEARYAPGGKPPPKHLHPAQDEEFEVMEGRINVLTPDGERTYESGGRIEIPRGTTHQIWNPHDRPARLVWRTRPAGRTESWFRDLDRLNREADDSGPSPLAFAVLLDEYDDVIRIAVGPRPLVRGAVSALAPIGRLRGHTAEPRE